MTQDFQSIASHLQRKALLYSREPDHHFASVAKLLDDAYSLVEEATTYSHLHPDGDRRMRKQMIPVRQSVTNPADFRGADQSLSVSPKIRSTLRVVITKDLC